MSLLVESIKIFNGRIYNLPCHETRANNSRLELWGYNNPIKFKENIKLTDEYSRGLVKCRILFDKTIHEINFEHYNIKKIRNLKVIESSNIYYPHKYLYREGLNKLFAKRDGNDEIIIVKDDKVTDAFYFNIVCCKDESFFTPAEPLLFGTQRQKLIDSGTITPKVIFLPELKNFDSIHLINAMTPLGKIVIPIDQIFY